MNYLFSILAPTSGLICFYSSMDGQLNLITSMSSFGGEFYFKLLTGFTTKLENNPGLKDKQELLVGFGERECLKINQSLKKVKLVYDVHRVHNECFKLNESKLIRIHRQVQYVSLKIQQSNTYTQYLLKPFLKDFKLSPSMGIEVDSGIDSFKQSFLNGLDHLSIINKEETNIIFNLDDSISEVLLSKAVDYPTQNGIISMELGNNMVSDFIYSLTKFAEHSLLCCFRHDGDKFGVSVAKITEKGKITLLSPSGINDTKNTIELIGLLNPTISGVELFKKNISDGLPLGDKVKDKKEVIEIKAMQVIVANKY